MSVWRLQCSWQADTIAPRERILITPHFEVLNPTPDIQQLCEDMLTGLQTISPFAGEMRVTGYDAQGTPPVYPQGEAIANQGLMAATNNPRELAICLSYYAERNIPRHRGRLYIPCFFLGVSTNSLRPGTGISNMTALVDLLVNLGGVDVDWCVYSRRDDRAYSATHWWYDDEWDVQRSRGLKGTARTQGVTDEAVTSAIELPIQ